MLTKFSMACLLLLLCAVFGLSAVPDCWGASRSLVGLQLLESGATTLTGTYALEQSLLDLHTSQATVTAPSSNTPDNQEVGIADHLSAAANDLDSPDSSVGAFDDALVGGMIDIASSLIFAEPYNGWRFQVEGDTRNVNLSLQLAW